MDFKRSTFETILIRLLSDMQWLTIISDHDDQGNLIYEGRNLKDGADRDDTDWYIWKYTNDGQLTVHEQGPLIGTYTGRADLDWNYAIKGSSSRYIENFETHSLLNEIIDQLKIVSTQLSLLTDEKINLEDTI
jgi:hypothetical protein